MATTPRNVTVSTRIESTADGGYRVAYDTPPRGYTPDELEALEVAIAIAQRQIAELPQSIAAPLDALTLQHDRMAAPC